MPGLPVRPDFDQPLVPDALVALAGFSAALWAAAAIMAASGLILLLLPHETRARRRTTKPAWEENPELVAP
jgi:hypothetical protein